MSFIMFTIFTRSAAVLIKISTPQMWRLFDGGVYLNVGGDKALFKLRYYYFPC